MTTDNYASPAPPAERRKGKIDKTYRYHDSAGNVRFEVVRYKPKGFSQRQPDGDGWTWNMEGVPPLLYRLPEVIAAIAADRIVYYTEGEKDADRLAELGLTATTNPGGVDKCTGVHAAFLHGAHVVTLPDNDEPGRRHAKKVAQSLQGIALSVRVVELPDLPEKGDVSDWLDAGYTADDLERLASETPEWTPPPNVGKGARAIRLIPFDELRPDTHQRELIRGIIPREGLVVVWGPPKCGKSFWVFDALMHVALGWPYRGRRVTQGPVVYCAFEGPVGFYARAEAFRRTHLTDDDAVPPFYLVAIRLNLVKDHAALIAEIRATLGDSAPNAITLDTLNRSIPGSENNDEDMGAYIEACDALKEAFGCAVIVVHHCGIDGNRPRGHTSLLGSVDAELSVKQNSDETVVVEVENYKDGQAGERIASELDVMIVGENMDHEPITSCAVLPAEVPDKPSSQTKLSKNQDAMLSVLRKAGPDGLTTEQWNARAKADGLGVNRHATLTETRKALKLKGYVYEGNSVWLVNE